MFKSIRQHFPRGEVDLYAVNWGENGPIVSDYVVQTGLSEPVLLDNRIQSPECHSVPGGAASLYEYFHERVGSPDQGPFPLHIVIDQAGRYAYLSKQYRPASIIATLRALVER